MPLTTTPLVRALPEPGQPFVVYAIWVHNEQFGIDYLRSDHPGGLDDDEVIRFSAANLPGAALGEFAVTGSLAVPLAQVRPDELPIALSLRLHIPTSGAPSQWEFDYLGQRDSFGEIWQIPTDVQPLAPTPLTFDQLNQGAEDMIRESLGLPPDVAIPEPAGLLPAEEASEEPYRFDPTRHMDLSMADAAPPLPPPAAEGPPPAPGAAVYAGPALQPTQDKQHGAFGDASVPFAH